MPAGSGGSASSSAEGSVSARRSRRSAMPSPVGRGDRRRPAARRARGRAGTPATPRPRAGRSSLLNATIVGFSRSAGSCARELVADDLEVPLRDRASEPSTTWTRIRVRSTWRRNACPRPAPLLRALDEPGHVRDRRPARVLVAEVEHAEVGLERRERVVGDLRAGGGQRGQQRRLAGVRQPDEPDVGDEPQLQADPALLAGLALLGVARRLVGGGLEVDVAEAAAAAAGDHHRSDRGPRGRPAARPSRRRRRPCPAARSSVRSAPALPWRLDAGARAARRRP